MALATEACELLKISVSLTLAAPGSEAEPAMIRLPLVMVVVPL